MRPALGRRLREGQHVPRNGRTSADNGMRADTHEMVHRTKRADAGPVFNGNVPAERGGVGHDDMASNLAIMSDVSVGHDQVMVADLREPAAFYRAAIDGNELANLVVIADFQARRFARVRDVLRRQADRREREESIVDADLRRSFHGDVRHQVAALAQFDPRPNYAVGSDLAGGVNLGFGVNDGCGVNGHSAKSTFLPEAPDCRRPSRAAPIDRSRPLRPRLYLRHTPCLRAGRRSSATPALRPRCATDLLAPPDAGSARARCR